MTPERLQEIRAWSEHGLVSLATGDAVEELLEYVDLLHAENAALRRGQGTAPAPATPGTTAYHVTHPIPDSTGGTR